MDFPHRSESKEQLSAKCQRNLSKDACAKFVRLNYCNYVLKYFEALARRNDGVEWHSYIL